MNKYVYSVVKELNENSSGLVNYLCKDKYIHIRLRDFGLKKEVISGLEDKLTFYITFLFEKVVPQYLSENIHDIVDESKYNELFDMCINKFKCSDEYSDLMLAIHCLYPSCLGINILPKYKRNKNTKDVILDKFGDTNLSKQYIQEDFHKVFGLYVYEFLSNENIFIVVDKKKKVNCIKYVKKYAKSKKNNLWEN